MDRINSNFLAKQKKKNLKNYSRTDNGGEVEMKGNDSRIFTLKCDS